MEARRSKEARNSEESKVQEGDRKTIAVLQDQLGIQGVATAPCRIHDGLSPVALRSSGGDDRRLGPIFSPFIPSCFIFLGDLICQWKTSLNTLRVNFRSE